MNTENFEKRLRGQPMRQIPAEWREEILSAAKPTVATRHPSRVTQLSWLSTFNRQVVALLWPNPQAWAGLAAIWILSLAVVFSVRDKSPALAAKSSPPSPEVVVELRQQKQLLAELLVQPGETHISGPMKTFDSQPRSERQVGILMT
jgi:hypothetical protein